MQYITAIYISARARIHISAHRHTHTFYIYIYICMGGGEILSLPVPKLRCIVRRAGIGRTWRARAGATLFPRVFESHARPIRPRAILFTVRFHFHRAWWTNHEGTRVRLPVSPATSKQSPAILARHNVTWKASRRALFHGLRRAIST